jgi:ketosteroid isomerase-like protein
MKNLTKQPWIPSHCFCSLPRVGSHTRAKMRCLSLFLLLASIASCGVKGENSRDVQIATEAVRKQIAKYTAALDAADIAIASEVWLTSPDVSFISPAGHQHGWEEVKKVYEYFGSAFSERKLTVRDVSVHTYRDSAWAEFYWHFEAKQRSDGLAFQTNGRETQVYRKVGDRWALVHVHYSGMPTTP